MSLDVVGNQGLRYKHLDSDSSISSTTAAEVTGLSVALEPGTYICEYYIRAQSATATVTPKYGVTHTGTVTAFMEIFCWPQATATATTGVMDGETNATAGAAYSCLASRVKGTILGPGTDVDTINSDIPLRLTVHLVVTVAGTLQLLHGSETATSTITKTGSSVIIYKIA